MARKPAAKKTTKTKSRKPKKTAPAKTVSTCAKQLDPFKFKSGQSGNPKGRPKGCRNKLSNDFIIALSADFDENGVEVIAAVRENSPAQYLKIVADLVPKDLNLNHSANEAFTALWDLMGRDKSVA